MSSLDKELEEQLIEAGNKLLDPPSSVEELLPLLEKAEYYLSRVEQSPNKSIEDVLSPCTKALVTDKLFRHLDIDVMVAVASCISEITRITAPEVPYTDEEMKEAFQLIVSSFERLDDMSSQSYTKRASILETVAKVRSCVVMLDLECDALILEMFQHFLKAIRDYHPEHVFSSMETIMTLVIEESEDFSPELLSPILDTLKKDNEGVLPIAKELGEKVLQNCSTKLKAYLGKALISLGTCMDDYSEVVSIICQDGSAENKTDATSAGEHEVVNEATSPISEASNGVKQTAENDSFANTVSVKQPEIVPQRTRLKITGLLSKDNPDKSDTEKEAKTRKSKTTHGKRGRQWSLMKKSTKPTGSTSDGKKEPGQFVENGKDPISNPPTSQRENQPTEADLPSDCGKKGDVGPSSKETAMESLDVSSPSKSEELKKKEGSLKESEGLSDSEMKENAKLRKKSGDGASNEDRTPIKVRISRKGSETTDDAKTNSVVPSIEKVNASTADKDGSSPMSFKVKDKKGSAKGKELHQKDMAVSLKKDADEEKADPLSKSSKKCQRDEDQPVKTPKDKGKRKRQGDEYQPVETPRGKGKRKRTPAKEASSVKEYGKDLVGSKVKVWWPKDKAFYEGVVDSFDTAKKKHMIIYTDGDVEILNLRKERWEIIRDDSGPDEEVAEETRELSPEMPLKKFLEMMSNKKLSAKKAKGISSKKSEVVSPISDHKPRGGSKNDGNLETDRSGKAKDNNTPNIGSKLVGLARRMTSKSKGSSESRNEDKETRKEKSKTPETEGRTPKSVGRPKKVKSGGSDKVKSGPLKTKPKESKEVDRDSGGEHSDKVKYSSSKPKLKESKDADRDSEEDPSDKVNSSAMEMKLKESKEMDSDSGEEPTDKVKSSSLKLKSEESKEVDTDSREESSHKVKSSLLKAKQKPKPRESKGVDMDSGEEPSDKVKSSSSKPKSKENEDVDMDSGEEEPSDTVKSNLLKPKLTESKEVDKDSGEEPSDNVRSSSPKPNHKPKLKDSEETSEKAKSNSSKLKPKENEEVDPDSGEETEKVNASKKEKPLAESPKTPASGLKTRKKHRQGA